MGSPIDTSSGSSLLYNSVSDEDFKQLTEQKKRKRMESNRESARRSRMKRQRHVDDLTAQVVQLKRENNRIITAIHVTNQLYMRVEGENEILRAQVGELSQRLESLNQIISCLSEAPSCYLSMDDGFGINNPWDWLYVNQPIMAFADVFQY